MFFKKSREDDAVANIFCASADDNASRWPKWRQTKCRSICRRLL